MEPRDLAGGASLGLAELPSQLGDVAFHAGKSVGDDRQLQGQVPQKLVDFPAGGRVFLGQFQLD